MTYIGIAMDKLKVVQIQYKTTRASPTFRLHNVFSKTGIESSVITMQSTIIGDPTITEVGRRSRWTAALDAKIQKKIVRFDKGQEGIFSYPVIGTDLSSYEQIKQADIIYVHWVLNGFMSMKNVEQLARLNKPIIFYMHDTWTITGGCHLDLGCEKFKTACKKCPLLSGTKNNDIASKGFAQKSRIFNEYDNLYFVAPSKWLYEKAKQSALTKNKPVFHIPNILENETFKHYDKKVSREILNLKADEKVVLFGALAVDSMHKGWRYLQQALEILNNEVDRLNITVLIFGTDYNKQIAEAIPFKVKFVGYLASDYATSLMYNAADVFVAPSLADNLPYTVLEAESCGTPVAAFRTGGIPEMIDHKQNGYLANYKDSTDLAKGILFCLESGIKGYRLPEFESEKVLGQYIKLMAEIHNMQKTT